MYSHGSSARVAGGKRGHGGREYRRPRKRRDPNATPPPLKECCCLVEIHLTEYQDRQPAGRQHVCFGGRRSMEQCHSTLRSDYQVHLMVPGRQQEGPVNMVTKTYREAISALAYLMTRLVGNDPIRGRIYRNVKESPNQSVDGTFLLHSRSSTDGPFVPHWLFESANWSVVACELCYEGQEGDSLDGEGIQQQITVENASVRALQTCLDNIIFRLGKACVGQLDIFFDDYLERAFAAGNSDQAENLFREISNSFAQSDNDV